MAYSVRTQLNNDHKFITMRKSIYLLLLTLVGFLPFNSNAQNPWAVRTSIGTASGINAVDGYYFSFDIGIPLLKSVELAPTFNFFSTIPADHIDNSWNRDFPGAMNSFQGNQDKEHYSGDVMGSMNLILLFKPFALFNNPNLDKHELAFGAGVGLKSYATVRAIYENIGSDYQLKEFGAESNLSVEPYYAKIFYNYHFNQKFFAGAVASLDGFDAEAVALFGVQLGMNFTTQK